MHTIDPIYRYRQTDALFIQCLGDLRSGNLNASVIKFFRDLVRPLPKRNDGLLPTLLKVTNADCRKVNTEQLKKLAQDIFLFKVTPHSPSPPPPSLWSPDDPPPPPIRSVRMAASAATMIHAARIPTSDIRAHASHFGMRATPSQPLNLH